MTSTPAALEVDKARAALREHAAHMTQVQTLTVTYDDASTRRLTAPSRLTLVEREHTSAEVGAFSARSRPPMRVDVLSLIEEIDAYTQRPADESRRDAVAGWCARRASGTGRTVVEAANLTAKWREQVDGILTPEPKYQLRGQHCPGCGAEKISAGEDVGAGESHTRPALEVDRTRGVTVCLACDEEWLPEMWPHLQAVLEQQRHEYLTEQGLDPRVRPRFGEGAPAYGTPGPSWPRMPAERDRPVRRADAARDAARAASRQHRCAG